MAFSMITNRNTVGTNFRLTDNQKKTVDNNLNELNKQFNNSKWCKVSYNSYMTRIYGIPYKRIIGKREIAIAPDTHIFVKEEIAKHFDPKMVEVLTNDVAKGYGLKVAEKEVKTEEPKPTPKAK